MDIRDATDLDAEGITVIYNDAVAHTTAIWNERLVDADNRRGWIADRRAAGFPVLVAVEPDPANPDAERVLGYATYGPFRPHDGFRRTVEHSVYVHGDQRGRGLGTDLMAALLDRARNSGVHVVVAGIDAANTGSIRLHERLGFTRVGTLREVGTKFGSWLDLAFLQLILDDGTPADR
ncbi:N-acetyltransferase family protein [Gordonia sp. NPDC003504]